MGPHHRQSPYMVASCDQCPVQPRWNTPFCHQSDLEHDEVYKLLSSITRKPTLGKILSHMVMIWCHSCAMVFTSCLPSSLLRFDGNCWDGSDTRDNSPFARWTALRRNRLDKRSDSAWFFRLVSSPFTNTGHSHGLSKSFTMVLANFLVYRSVNWDRVHVPSGNLMLPSITWCCLWFIQTLPCKPLNTLFDVVMTIIRFLMGSWDIGSWRPNWHMSNSDALVFTNNSRSIGSLNITDVLGCSQCKCRWNCNWYRRRTTPNAICAKWSRRLDCKPSQAWSDLLPFKLEKPHHGPWIARRTHPNMFRLTSMHFGEKLSSALSGLEITPFSTKTLRSP